MHDAGRLRECQGVSWVGCQTSCQTGLAEAGALTECPQVQNLPGDPGIVTRIERRAFIAESVAGDPDMGRIGSADQICISRHARAVP